ncbi:hypothetical protein H5410_004929 [Solanum commersonii]|uniref:Uncharacterized protein n=1 Tax=Solanum commersonii TaxID=4109 RepID=A0A9J6A6N2_SOLCO|nr:hypothetical protein H5410_004929 [Solanum commersonii]
MGLEIACCSTMLSPQGKGQVGDEMGKLAHRRSVPQIVNTISSYCFWLAQERGSKTKTTKLIADATDNELAKTEVVLNAAYRCLREIDLIQEFEIKHGHYMARRNKAAEKNEEMKA